jgi:serine/threonine protein kinase
MSSTALRNPDTTFAEKKKWISQLHRAVKILEKHSIIHSDLRPSNILIDSAGNLRLGDFGLAIKREEGTVSPFIGTFEYSSPETVKDRCVSICDNIWQFGVTMFEMLFNKPFVDRSIDGGDSSFLGMDEAGDAFFCLDRAEDVRDVADRTFKHLEGYYYFAQVVGLSKEDVMRNYLITERRLEIDFSVNTYIDLLGNLLYTTHYFRPFEGTVDDIHRHQYFHRLSFDSDGKLPIVPVVGAAAV